jgi:hypothetical protein
LIRVVIDHFWSLSISFVRRLLIAAYLIEAGLLLIVAPWTGSWQHNYFGVRMFWLGEWMANQYVRGAVSGIGVVTSIAGLRDLSAAIVARHSRTAAPPVSGPLS